MAVVIPTYNRPAWIIATIEGVLAQHAQFLKEVLVVDQSDDVSVAQARVLEAYDRQKRIRWIRSRTPHPSHARNRALLQASADIVLFLDDDVIPRPDLLRRHYHYYAEDARPHVAGVTGQLHTRIPAIAPETITLGNYQRCTVPVQPEDAVDISPPSCHPILASCNASVRRKAIMAVGGFDENLCFNEDRDVTFRLHAARTGRLVYDPEAWVVHLRAPSGGCRTVGTRPRTEIERQVPSVLFLLRHYRAMNGLWRRQLVMDSVRCGPLRRQNVLRVWRQPMAWACFGAAIWCSLRERTCVRSVINGNSYHG
jgi:glycosyltransferase involved in cell wall biosynthesis